MYSIEEVENLIENIDKFVFDQRVQRETKERLEKSIENLQKEINLCSEDLDIVTNAITILREISDDSVKVSYEFIETQLNKALERVFTKSVRKIRLKEYTRSGQYPQLEIELTVEGGVVRSLKSDSGHGVMQIVSLLCVLSVIVITGSRRILALDEVLSGLSAKARMIIDDILWAFVSIGFQFIINEHGFIPKGAQVLHLENNCGISEIKESYIASKGSYLDNVVLSEVKTEYIDDDEDEQLTEKHVIFTDSTDGSNEVEAI